MSSNTKLNEIKLKILAAVRDEKYRPVPISRLAALMGIGRGERQQYMCAVRRLMREGELSLTKARCVVPAKPKGGVNVKILTVNKKGAYAAPEDKSGDYFIPLDRLASAMPGDMADVRVISRSGRLPTAEVVAVTQRNFVEFTGTFVRRGKTSWIMPDGGYKGRIDVARDAAGAAHDREKVLARMISYPDRAGVSTAQVLSCYGPADSAAACCRALLDARKIHQVFPADVLGEAKKAVFDASECAGRLDLRGEPIFTIDGPDTKDIDDAVSVKKTAGGFELGVHIADVSHYVAAGSALDREAFERGTSIYFADSVLPMLPKELSNGVCSLNPGEDRLAFSAIMNVDAAGTVTLGRLVKSVIRSRVKGVYGEVNALFGDKADETLRDKYADVLPEFAAMRELAGILRAAKTKRGALNFDSGDREIILDENGVACGVKREERGEAELMIEDFMLCANEAVAKYALSHKLPFVYRVHEEPGREKLEVLAAALRAAGVDAQKLRPGVTPLELADILGRAASSPKAKLLGNIALRSMAKARYSPDCLGHFGLALSEYCHFTSPIRRYPDLSIHRILSDSVAGVAQDEIVKRYTDFAVSSSAHSSECEVTAMQVEWDCDDIYAAEYMSRHIGERFDGTISSVKQFGMYVELENTVEGLVRIDKLPGWYEYDERAFALRCPQTGKCHTVGDAVKVIAEHADIPSGQIDFELI